MKTWAELKTEILKRTGNIGAASSPHLAKAVTAMENALKLLLSVKWDCTKARSGGSVYINGYKTDKQPHYINGATSCHIVNGTISPYCMIDEESFYMTPDYPLIRGTLDEVIYRPPSVTGRPTKWVLNAGGIYVGCPNAAIAYTFYFYYWPTYFSTPADASTPDIIKYLGDGVFIAASLWIFAKYFEMEEDPPQISGSAFQELLVLARLAQERNSFQGPSLEEIIRQRA